MWIELGCTISRLGDGQMLAWRHAALGKVRRVLISKRGMNEEDQEGYWRVRGENVY